MKYTWIILLCVILFFIFIILFIPFARCNVFTTIKSQFLPHNTIWKSNSHEYNPSISNNIIAIRYCNQSSLNWWGALLGCYVSYQNDIILYHGQNYSLKIVLHSNMEDPRIFYYQGTYYCHLHQFVRI